MAHYNLNEFDQAIAQFEAGYRAAPEQAVFLYNIAQAHRLADRPQKALEFYRKYLQQDPSARNREEVEARISTLEKFIQDSAKATAKPPLPPEPPPATEPPPAGAALPAVALQATPPPPKPKRRVWPIVVGVVGGVLLAGAAVGLGVGLTQSGGATPVWSAVAP